MSNYIYLYGHGETKLDNGEMVVFENCYFKCFIPDDYIKNGLFPSVLHSYIMYAKDIGLIVDEVFFDKNISFEELQYQLVYSLWPLFYVNNSSAFTDKNEGIGVWEIASRTGKNFNLKHLYQLKLNTKHGYFYQDDKRYGFPMLMVGANVKKPNPEPLPGNFVVSDSPWYLELKDPKVESGLASSYAINRHYNLLVVWNTLSDIQKILSRKQKYNGLKQATGQVLKAVTDRQYAYDAMVPKWSNNWGEKPDSYENMRNDINNYNIGASLFLYKKELDPNSPDTSLKLFGTALNIKGKIKAGHAETRLLLTLDTIDYANKRSNINSNWFNKVVEFYALDTELGSIDIEYLHKAYNNKNLSFVSSLKPCYLCMGEIDATEDGFINTINNDSVGMWACFPFLKYYPKIKEVLYFDIDRPISYPSYIKTKVYIDGIERHEWEIYLAPWDQWSAFLNRMSNNQLSLLSPIGSRIVEPAGECLKTGEAFTRYKNSSYLLLTDKSEYISEFENLTTGVAEVNEDDLDE
jgi:hypothetical protein